jgi:acyl dehydratase
MAETLAFDYTAAQARDAWPALSMPPVSRLTLALYCGASGDHNPLHVDADFARDAGLGDVIAHGMLVMGYMGRTLTRFVPQPAIREFNTRFQAMTRVGDEITCTGEVTAREVAADGTTILRVSVSAADQRGEIKTQGEAVIALPT